MTYEDLIEFYKKNIRLLFQKGIASIMRTAKTIL